MLGKVAACVAVVFASDAEVLSRVGGTYRARMEGSGERRGDSVPGVGSSGCEGGEPKDL